MTEPTPLGRGLGSLIPKARPASTEPAAVSITPPAPVAPSQAPSLSIRQAQDRRVGDTEVRTAGPRQGLYDIPTSLIDPNPHQPRHRIQAETLDDLVSSIRQHGILQPLIVSKHGQRYQLIAGERRFRSAERLGLETVPAIVRDSQELQKLEWAIIENVQRENLNPLEEAQAYQQLSDEFGLTQDEISKKVGKSRATVANTMRLLQLPPEMLQAIREGKITASHAKILLSAVTPSERQKLFDQIMNQQLPVRAASQLGRTTTVRRYTRRQADPLVRAQEDELRGKFGTKVTITKRDGRGRVNLEFYSDEEFDNLINRLRTLN